MNLISHRCAATAGVWETAPSRGGQRTLQSQDRAGQLDPDKVIFPTKVGHICWFYSENRWIYSLTDSRSDPNAAAAAQRTRLIKNPPGCVIPWPTLSLW